MQNIDANKCLDDMLKWFYEMGDNVILYSDFRKKYHHLQEFGDKRDLMRNACLNKLVSDGYISPKNIVIRDGDNNTVIGNEEGYCISFEGIIFAQNGYYKSNTEKEERQKRRQILQEYSLITGTWVASLAASGLVFFEYVKLNHHYPYGLRFWQIACVMSLILISILTPILLWKSKNKKSKNFI